MLLQSATLDIVYPVDDGTDGLVLALDRLCKEVSILKCKGNKQINSNQQ